MINLNWIEAKPRLYHFTILHLDPWRYNVWNDAQVQILILGLHLTPIIGLIRYKANPRLVGLKPIKGENKCHQLLLCITIFYQTTANFHTWPDLLTQHHHLPSFSPPSPIQTYLFTKPCPCAPLPYIRTHKKTGEAPHTLTFCWSCFDYRIELTVYCLAPRTGGNFI